MSVGALTSSFADSISVGSLIVAALLAAFVVVAETLLIYYALRTKGHVRAEFTHGATVFRLEAKERIVENNRTGRAG